MTASRLRIVVPTLLLFAVAVVIVALLAGSGGRPDAAGDPSPQRSASVTVETPGGDAEPREEPSPVTARPPGDADPQAQPSPAPAPDVARRIEGDPMAAGPVDAAVSVVVYSDYGCPYCQQWAQDTQPTVLEYAAQGDVRVEWRDVGILGEESTRAATAAAAAAQQGMFWEFHDALFAQMDARSDEQLAVIAADLGLDVDQFTADLTGPAVVSIVQANMQEGRSLGVQSTPSFLVGGTPVVGAQPTEVFVELIEDALAR